MLLFPYAGPTSESSPRGRTERAPLAPATLPPVIPVAAAPSTPAGATGATGMIIAVRLQNSTNS